MKILGIEIEGVGMFAAPTRIEGLGPGVNILSAHNEAGKSTIFKAIRACLFERHSTRNQEVLALATTGRSLPVTVSLDFEHDDERYKLTKSFLKSSKAELRREGKAFARDREADDQAWSLLGIAPGSGRSVDEAAFGLLWVAQGKSLAVPQPTAAATTALNEAIQQEVGELVGGERARTVLRSLQSDLDKLVTTRGPKTGGPYHDAQRQLSELADELSTAEHQLTNLDERITELTSKRSEHERLIDPREDARINGELESVRQALQQGEDALRLLQEAEKDEKLAASKHKEAETALNNLRERAERIKIDRNKMHEIKGELCPLAEQERKAREKIKNAEQAVTEIDKEEEKRQQRLEKLNHIASVIQNAEQKPQLQKLASELRNLKESLIQNRLDLSDNRVTTKVVKELNRLERDLNRLTDRMEAAAPQVEVALGASAAGQVWIGEDVLAEDTSLHAMEPLEIRVGELATITVSPPAGADKNAQKDQKRLQGKLERLLTDLGAVTPTDVRRMRDLRQDLELGREAIKTRMEALGVVEEELAAEAEKIREKVQEIDRSVHKILDDYSLGALPALEEINSERQSVSEGQGEASQKRKDLEGKISAHNEELNETIKRLAAARGEKVAIQRRLEGELLSLPDADRERLISGARKAFEKASKEYERKAVALKDRQRQAPKDEEVESLRRQVGQIEESLRNRRTEVEDLGKAIARLEGGIENAGGDGLGEKEQTLREQHALVSREVKRHERRVATLKLLAATIKACYQEQRERLHAPLLRHLRPFLHDVFPLAELKLGDGFAVKGLKRDGPDPENFERLSDGTKEQIAVLVRLAMGAMLCERGQEAPIILDDALVFSDDTRIEQMFNALTRAGENQQVIIFTCRSRTFETLGGCRLSIRQDGG